MRKYEVGDRVKIKDLDWYNKNKDANGDVLCFYDVHKFTKEMSKFCGAIVTISTNLTGDGEYLIKEDDETDWWTYDMIECKVEEETNTKYEDEVTGEYYSTPKYLVRPSGYQFVDENGNIINARKIILKKEKKKDPINMTPEQINAMVHDSCVLFCKHCGCGIPRETCTSLGTCNEHDDFRTAIRIQLCNMNKNE